VIVVLAKSNLFKLQVAYQPVSYFFLDPAGQADSSYHGVPVLSDGHGLIMLHFKPMLLLQIQY